MVVFYKAFFDISNRVGVGFEPNLNTMKNADIYICRVIGNNTAECIDSFARDVGVPTPDTELGGTDDIIWVRGTEQNGITTIEFRRKIDTSDSYDKPITAQDMKLIFAFNPDTDEFLYHGPTRSASVTVNLRPGLPFTL